jgi:hypothetical protein
MTYVPLIAGIKEFARDLEAMSPARDRHAKTRRYARLCGRRG